MTVVRILITLYILFTAEIFWKLISFLSYPSYLRCLSIFRLLDECYCCGLDTCSRVYPYGVKIYCRFRTVQLIRSIKFFSCLGLIKIVILCAFKPSCSFDFNSIVYYSDITFQSFPILGLDEDLWWRFTFRILLIQYGFNLVHPSEQYSIGGSRGRVAGCTPLLVGKFYQKRSLLAIFRAPIPPPHFPDRMVVKTSHERLQTSFKNF